MLGTSKSKTSWVLIVVALLICAISPVTAQPDDHVLIPGQPVSGVLGDDNVAQIYTFTAIEGETVSLTLSSQSPGLGLTLVVSDAQGTNLGHVKVTEGTPAGENRLADISLRRSGTYYVTIFPSGGETSTSTGTFSLVLEQVGVVPPPVETTPVGPTTFEQSYVSLLNGMEVNLRWNTRDDLNLEIRDPTGEALHWDSRSTSSGGTFGVDVNGLCETLTDPPAVETASWPSGAHAAGSYEILVYYVQACEGNSPVDFTVDVSVDGVALTPIQGTLQPPVNNVSNVFIASFRVAADADATVEPGGIYVGTRPLPITPQELFASGSTSVAVGQTVEGIITGQQPWQTFNFAGQAGEVVEIRMSRTLGSLDTLLLVLDSTGNIIAANDDTELTTDSLISNLRLPTTDTYTIVATRYGKDIGGTEGTYELQVATPSLPAGLLNLDLPSGDVEITLTWNTNADLQLSVRDPFGSMVYDDVRRVQSGGRLEITGNINCTVSEGEPVYYIYWPGGFRRQGTYEVNVWYQSECEDTRPVIFTLYVVVDGKTVATETATIQWNERYLMNFTVGQPGEAQARPGGLMGGSETFGIDFQTAQASAFKITSGDIVTGGITAEHSYDLYTFDGEAGDIVTVSMNQTSGILDTLLFIIDPNGVEIARNDDIDESTNSLINDLTLSQEGQYTIIATRFGTVFGGTTGGYELAFRLNSG